MSSALSELNYLRTLALLCCYLPIALSKADSLSVLRSLNGEAEYACEGFVCDWSSNSPDTPRVFKKGSVVRICVRQTEFARNDGIFMKRIDYFAFKRDEIPISQDAIEGGEAASNGLTYLDFREGDAVCSLKALLGADFYSDAGSTIGTGLCTMQVGGNDRSETTDYSCPAMLPPTPTHTVPWSPFEASNIEAIHFDGDSIAFQTTVGSDAIVLSKKPHVGVGDSDEIELTVHLNDRSVTAPGYQPQLVLFFAPETVSIQDLITNDHQFSDYFEPAVVAWMRHKIHKNLQNTFFIIKARDPSGIDEEKHKTANERMLSNGAVRLKRSNGMITASYSFDAGVTWTQIGDALELPDEYKSAPLNVGYRILREWRCDYRLETTPLLVSGGETEATTVPSLPSYFNGSNADTAFTSCDATGCTMAGGAHDQGALLSTGTFSGDFNFRAKVESREYFGGGYQAGLEMFFATSDKTLSDFTGSDDDAKSTIVSRLLDKIHFNCCWHTWLYYSTQTADGVLEDGSTSQTLKNLNGYLRLQRINHCQQSLPIPHSRLGFVSAEIGLPDTISRFYQ